LKKLCLFVSLSLLGCGSVPELPKGPMCRIIWTGDVNTSYEYCRELPSNLFLRREPLLAGLERGDVCTTPDYFAALLEYLDKLDDWAAKYCNGGINKDVINSLTRLVRGGEELHLIKVTSGDPTN